MRNKNFGFTLAEVLISILVVGIIMAAATRTLRIVKASYTSLAHFEFQNIRQMAGEMIAGSLSNNNDTGIETDTMRTEGGMLISIITKDDTKFCNYLVKLTNSIGSNDCNNLYNASIPDQINGVPNTEPIIGDLEPEAPTFKTMNGRRYYVTKRTTNSNVSDEFGFRLIAVDLNGPAKPNVAVSQAMFPDIVTFLMLDTGEIFPVGVAADNIKIEEKKEVRYLNSRLKGYYFEDKTRANNTGVPVECLKLSNKDFNGNVIDGPVCNFAVVNVPNRNRNDGTSFYSYREAYCASLGKTGESPYLTYCDKVSREEFCPPTNSEKQFDLCRVENTKPMFRYNL